MTLRPKNNNQEDLLNDSALYSQPQEEDDSFNFHDSEVEDLSHIDDRKKLNRDPDLFEDTRSDLNALQGMNTMLDKISKPPVYFRY